MRASLPTQRAWVLIEPPVTVVGHLTLTVESETIVVQQCYIDGHRPGARQFVNRLLDKVGRAAGVRQIVAVTQRSPKAFARAFGCSQYGYVMRRELSS